MYQRKVDVDMLNAVKSVLADVSSVSLRQSKEIHCTFYRHADADQTKFSQGLVFHCVNWVVEFFVFMFLELSFFGICLYDRTHN